MADALSLIAAFHEINTSKEKNIACFTPSLIGMFGSANIFDSFLSEVESAITSNNMPESTRIRATNLTGTFIPQVAEYNGIDDASKRTVTADELRNISAETLESRRNGVEIILSALISILNDACKIA